MVKEMVKKKKEIAFARDEWNVGRFILEDSKRKEVMEKLSKSEMYFNQLCRKIRGSRSVISNTLDDLVAKGIIEFEWKIIARKEAIPNPAPFSAVKMFRIKKEHLETVKKLNL